MRHQLLWNTLTLLGTTVIGASLWADTPVKPSQASFPSLSSQKPATVTTTAPVAKATVTSKTTIAETETKPVIDYAIKAATVEVAWLQDPVTYPLHLRAEQLAGQDAIVLTGYVPNEKIRDKAVFLARLTTGNLVIVDQLQVHPQMVLSFDAPVEPNQALVVQDTIEKAAPGIGKTLHITVESNGITTVSGRVDEFGDRLKVIHSLQGIPGCTAIRYDLRVLAPGSSPANIYAAAQTTVPAPPVKLAPAVAVQPAKSDVPTSVGKQVEGNTPVVVLQRFPKLIGSVTSVRPSSPSNTAVEQKVAANSPAPTIVQATFTQTVDQKPVNDTEKIISSSLSGLFPPGTSGRSIEPGIQLGTPVIVRASLESVTQKPDVIKSKDLTQTSTAQSPPTLNPIPESINHMPRSAK